MGLRYRKSINLGPLRINLSKSGVGYSYGVKGYRVTHTADGKVRTTVSVPGTGVSHVQEVSEEQYRRRKQTKRQERREKSGMPTGVKLALAGLLLFFVFIAIAGCSADEPAPAPSMSVQEAIAMVEGTRAPTQPQTEPKTEPAPAPTEPAPEPEPTEPATQQSVAYIGNKNSKKFHELGCGSVTDMKEKNKVELYSREDAINMGYDPCGRCKP